MDPLKPTFHEHSSTPKPIDNGIKPPRTLEIVQAKFYKFYTNSIKFYNSTRPRNFMWEPWPFTTPFDGWLCIEHFFIWLPMDPSMLWCHCWINKAWFKVVGKTLAWKALEIVKFDNTSYRHTIAIQGLPRLSLKSWLKFELECLQYCIMTDDSLDSLYDIETWDLYMNFHYVHF